MNTIASALELDQGGIVVRGLTKRFGSVSAVDDLSFDARPGQVTGFLGPNGSGKSTTLRMVLGLVRPDAGAATLGGRAYRDLARPTATAGAVLDPNISHPACTGWDHLMIYARMSGHGRSRVAAVVDELELGEFVRRRTGGYSTGMRQRLNLATALLGDPAILILDEPSNGLDPQGIAWLRRLLRRLAAEGRTILISSHVLSEVQQIVDQVIMIKEGRLVGAGTMIELTGRLLPAVEVRTPVAARLIEVVTAEHGSDPQLELRPGPTPDRLTLRGLDNERLARLALRHGLLITELTSRPPSLEQLFLDLTTEPAGPETTVTTPLQSGVPA
ncbi:ABC transporter ATP-binding protein [Microlunatus speluncae]|uniref:ABC transporter ATP-binding protein n=1 Tax=Microlunatus speluncae TaxID=2594267 RepID=UPI0012666E8A|nr:ATP-binding cassette domain-containing protein [Microlunatus speluncae]